MPATGSASSKLATICGRICPAAILLHGIRPLSRALEPAAPASRGVYRLFQANDELGRVGAPIDRNHVRAAMRRHHFLEIVRDDGGHRNHEILAEIAPRVPGNRIRHFADEILDVFIAGVGFLHAHQQHGEHAARRAEVNDALAAAGDADDAGVFVGPGIPVRHEVGRSHGGRLLRRNLEIVRRSIDECPDLFFLEHHASDNNSSNASLSWRSVNGLHRKPLAPFSMASTAVALSASAETTRISTLELIATNSCTHSTPSISGMVRSMVTTCGCVRRNNSTASRPLLAAPTTSRRAICWERSMRRRMMFESSTIMSFNVGLGWPSIGARRLGGLRAPARG